MELVTASAVSKGLLEIKAFVACEVGSKRTENTLRQQALRCGGSRVRKGHHTAGGANASEGCGAGRSCRTSTITSLINHGT